MSSGSVSRSTVAESMRSIAWGRIAGILFGAGTQLLFLGILPSLFLFLRYGGTREHSYWVLSDLILTVGFAVPHSILLMPSVSKWMKRLIPSELQGCVHCTVTCLSLLVLFQCWGRSSIVLWSLTGFGEWFMIFGFYTSWVLLFYSLYLTGLGYQTGLLPWWCWMRRQPLPKRPFVVTGSYRWMRHPVYMSFLGLIWFTPIMTLDHAILTGVWTAYVYLGSYFKDRRLLRFIGEPYREYAKRVPGLPIIGVGSLRRWQA